MELKELSKEEIDVFSKHVRKENNEYLIEQYQRIFENKAPSERALRKFIDIALDNKHFKVCKELSDMVKDYYPNSNQKGG